jgi:hypothetical protein
MGKLDDFYKKIEGNEKLKEALRAVKQRYEGKDVSMRAAFIGDIIKIAKNDTGIDLTPEDFGPIPDELSEEALAGVSGGVINKSNAFYEEPLDITDTDRSKRRKNKDWNGILDDKIYLA